MKLKFARTQSRFRTATLPAAGMLLCFWTAIVSAQTNNYNFSFAANLAVPDGDTSGLAIRPDLTGLSGSIASVTVSLDISGGFNGDLYAYLAGPNGGFAVLLNRVGVGNGNAFGYADTGFSITFDDSLSYENIHHYQDSSYTLNGGGQLTGIWATDGRTIDPLSDPAVFELTTPAASLDSFDGTDLNGTWTLFVADMSGGGQSTIINWGLTIETVPEPSAGALVAIGAGILLAARRRINGFLRVKSSIFQRHVVHAPPR